MKPRLVMACLAISFALLPGCIGDRSHDVVITNGTAAHVTVYPYGQQEPKFRHELAVGESYQENMLTTDTNDDGFVTVVEALNDANIAVFCHRYTYGELRRLGWRIELKSGTAC